MACYLQCICLDHENMKKESSHQVVWPHELKVFASTDQVKYGQQFYKTASCSSPLPHLSKNTLEIIKMIFLPPELEAQTAGKPSLSEIPSCRYLLQSNFNVFSYTSVFQLHKCVFRTFCFFSHGKSLTYLYTSFSFLVDQPVALFYKCF